MKFATFSSVAILLIQTSSAIQILDSISNLAKGVTKHINDLHSTSKDIIFVIKEAKNQLRKVEKDAKNLILLADRKLNEAERTFNATIEKQEDELVVWSNEQAQKGKKGSDETKIQIYWLIYNVLESYRTNSRSCTDKTLKPIKNLRDQTQKTVEGSFQQIDSLVAKIDYCSRLNNKNQHSISKCASEVKYKLKAIYALHAKYSNLYNQVKNINVKNYERSCAVDVVAKIKKRKNDVTKQIDDLVKKDKGKQLEREAVEGTEGPIFDRKRPFSEHIEHLKELIKQLKK